jgi:hypothetical protein
MQLRTRPTNHVSAVKSCHQSLQVVRCAKCTVETVQILLPVSMPRFAIRCPGLNLRGDRRDPDLLILSVLTVTAHRMDARYGCTHGSESHVLNVVQLLDDTAISTSTVLAHRVTRGCDTSVGARKSGQKSAMDDDSTTGQRDRPIG